MNQIYQFIFAILSIIIQASANPFHFAIWPRTSLFFSPWQSGSLSLPHQNYHQNFGFSNFLRHEIRLPPLQPDLTNLVYGPPGHHQPQQQQQQQTAQQPANIYGPPPQEQHQLNAFYGPPPQQNQPSGIYGPPQQQHQPASTYGPPLQQQQHQPASTYGPPPQQQQQQPANIYGPPSQQPPNNFYGLPSQQQSGPSFGSPQLPFFGSSSFFQPNFAGIPQLNVPELPGSNFLQNVLPLIPRPGPPVFVPRPGLQAPSPTYLPPVQSSTLGPISHSSIAHDSTTPSSGALENLSSSPHSIAGSMDSAAAGNQQISTLLSESIEQENDAPKKQLNSVQMNKVEPLKNEKQEIPPKTTVLPSTESPSTTLNSLRIIPASTSGYVMESTRIDSSTATESDEIAMSTESTFADTEAGTAVATTIESETITTEENDDENNSV